MLYVCCDAVLCAACRVSVCMYLPSCSVQGLSYANWAVSIRKFFQCFFFFKFVNILLWNHIYLQSILSMLLYRKLNFMTSSCVCVCKIYYYYFFSLRLYCGAVRCISCDAAWCSALRRAGVVALHYRSLCCVVMAK